jgi:O-antigen/teichoic acid export membrane protein
LRTDRDSNTATVPSSSPQKSIIQRFAHLLSAQGIEAVTSMVFFLYLARLDASVFGEVMYAMAAGSIVMKVVQFGLYYPLVSDLGSANPGEEPEILNRVNVIKFVLLIPSMAVILGMVFYRGFSLQMGLVIVFVCLGFALEAFAETFFADFRVRGLQDREARARITSSVVSYGFGFGTAALGFSPVVVSLFKLISAGIRTWYGAADYLKDYSAKIVSIPHWPIVWKVFSAASVFAVIEILGIIYNKTNIFFLEGAAGVNGVALYSATWNLVDPVSILASEQFLGWVIFPLLATLWWKRRQSVDRLVRSNAQWLTALAFPIMFVLHTESALMIGLVYGQGYEQAIWMQQYLVWTILISFQNNLFSYVMMVAGAAKVLLAFTVAVTVLNLVFNFVLVAPLGLEGACLVIILTKLSMMMFTFLYCQIRFRFFGWRDFLFPISLAVAGAGVFVGLESLITLHPAVIITLALYSGAVFLLGPRFMGRLPAKKTGT